MHAPSALTVAEWLAVWGPVVGSGWLGAVVASFLCVVAERVPAGRSLGGRSRCVCGRQLRAWENVPVLSWVVLRGTARCCRARIPARYVLAEAGLGIWFALAAAVDVGAVVFGGAAVAGAAILVVVCWQQR